MTLCFHAQQILDHPYNYSSYQELISTMKLEGDMQKFFFYKVDNLLEYVWFEPLITFLWCDFKAINMVAGSMQAFLTYFQNLYYFPFPNYFSVISHLFLENFSLPNNFSLIPQNYPCYFSFLSYTSQLFLSETLVISHGQI